MEIYLVGGAVRDELLGLPVIERDWVVVGATEDDMLRQGFRRVGKDFPVFLHPKTGEEYALARTERKQGKGYRGFVCDASVDVTLEEDLQRRDLTINAIAKDAKGHIIDPFAGQQDLLRRCLRHVSLAFTEDPVRILRLARLYARFYPQGFQVAEDTARLLKQMVRAGEVDHLVAERVWQEFARALATQHPEKFIELLRQCGALAVLFPEIDQLFGVPNPPQHHPEIDSGIHTLMSLSVATQLSDSKAVRFATLLHDLGKACTPPDQWPKHHGHDAVGVALIKALCARYRVPKAYQKLAEHVSRYHILCHKCREATAKPLLAMFEKIDAFRQPQRLTDLLLACEADSRGRLGFLEKQYLQKDFLLALFVQAQLVDIKGIIASGLTGKAIADELHRQRKAVMQRLCQEE